MCPRCNRRVTRSVRRADGGTSAELVEVAKGARWVGADLFDCPRGHALIVDVDVLGRNATVVPVDQPWRRRS
jgi:hypothetical protein